MESPLIPSKHKVLFVPVNFSALAIVEGKRLPMRVEELGRSGLLLTSKEYVQPRTTFEVVLKRPGEPAPIYALVTATFVERKAEGCAIAARISCISTPSHGRWQGIYDQYAAKRPLSRAMFCLEKLTQKQSLVLLGGALPSGVRQSLHYFGVDVKVAFCADEAIELVRRGAVLIIRFASDWQEPGDPLSRQLDAESRPPQLLLLSDGRSLFDSTARAPDRLTHIVAWPCSPAMLVPRILALLSDVQTPREAEPFEYTDSSLAARGEWFDELVNLWSVHPA